MAACLKVSAEVIYVFRVEQDAVSFCCLCVANAEDSDVGPVFCSNGLLFLLVNIYKRRS